MTRDFHLVPTFVPAVRGLILAALGCATITLVAACGKPNSGATTGAGAAGAAADSDDQCGVLVASIHDTFQLQRLEITTTVPDGVARLNDWQNGCAPALTSGSELTPPVRKAMTASQRDRLSEKHFMPRDGVHLRDAVLIRSLGQFAFQTVQSDPTDLQRVVAAFDFVIRNVQLVPKAPFNLPLTLYEIGLLGRGTAADRAWLFASLLHNEKIDCVLLVAEAEAGSTNEAEIALCGVLLDGKTYLFDPLQGVPLPSRERPTDPAAVATLDQALSDPAVLRQFDVRNDFRYPLDAARLRKARVMVISDSTFWTDRMRALQSEFAGQQAMVVADPLHDAPEGRGVWSRVAQAGGEHWSAESLELWNYPEQQLAAYDELDKTHVEFLVALLAPFGAYQTIAQDREGNLVLSDQHQYLDPAGDKQAHKAIRVVSRTTAGAQRRARLKHLSGEFADAVHEYQLVRKHSQEVVNLSPPPKILVPHQKAIDDSIFWTALCKYEQGEYRVAIDNLLRYRKQQGQSPEASWNRECRYLLALCYAGQQKFDEAIKELSGAEVDDPEFAGYDILMRRWRAAAESK